MTDRWEYMSVTWIYSTTNQNTVAPTTWKGEYSIARPGQPRETRLSYDSTDKGAETTGIDALLNELGADGWELVSETVMDTTIFSSLHGWSDSGTPTQMRWSLKRRA